MNQIDEKFCLGVDCMAKCDTCQNLKNWEILNEMPNDWRKQAQLERECINETQCQITNGCYWVEINT